MRLSKPALLLLDAGNTVVFLDHEALSAAARHAGIEVSAQALERAEPVAKRRYELALKQGISHEDGWTLHMQAIYEAAGRRPEEARRASEAAREAHAEFNLWRRVPADLSEALDEAASSGIRLGVVSNSEGQLAALFDRLGLSRHFEHVVDSALEGVRKPDPEIFRRALARFGMGAEQALYAGDIPQVDVDGARAAGMEAVLIDPLNHYPEYTDAPRFASVVELVRSLSCARADPPRFDWCVRAFGMARSGWSLCSFSLWVVLLSLCGCAGSSGNSLPQAGSTELADRWRYEIRLSEDLRSLDATICFEGPTPRELRAGKDEAATRLRYARWISPGSERRLTVERGRILLGFASERGCVAYGVDLADGGGLGAAVRRVRGSVLASPNAWLWRPERRARGAHASLTLVLSEGVRASVPWPRAEDGQTFELGSDAFAFDSNAAFGKLGLVVGEHRGIPFEATLLDAEHSPDPTLIAGWMNKAIEIASLGPGGFPAPRMHVIMVPIATDGEPVAFGSVTRGGTGSVLLFVSPDVTLTALESDWVLPHELSHLFLPYVAREHAWFSEGAATYYQEVLRARGGVLAEHEGLLNIVRSTRAAAQEGTGRVMRDESRAMHQTHAFRSVYWGGAAFFLRADVELRQKTHGKQSLDTVLAALEAEGFEMVSGASIEELLRRMDQHAGIAVFEPLAATCLTRPFPELEPMLRELGVHGEGDEVAVWAEAPLANVREAIFGLRKTEASAPLMP